jgi:hypothetical protein
MNRRQHPPDNPRRDEILDANGGVVWSSPPPVPIRSIADAMSIKATDGSHQGAGSSSEEEYMTPEFPNEVTDAIDSFPGARVASALTKAKRKRGRRGAKKRCTASKPHSAAAVDVKHMMPELYAKVTEDTDDYDAECYADLPTGPVSGDQPEVNVQSAVTKATRMRGKRAGGKLGPRMRILGSKSTSDAIDIEHMTPDRFYKITHDSNDDSDSDSDHRHDTNNHAGQTAGEWPRMRSMRRDKDRDHFAK